MINTTSTLPLFSKKIIHLLVWSTLMRLIVGASIGLGNDEVYYRIYADQLQWNYFDHPPMVGWAIRFFTANLNLDYVLFIRLAAIVCGTLTAAFIYLIGKKWIDEKTGFNAALMYCVSIYGGIIAGVFILPDSPQVLFWSMGIYSLLQAIKYEQQSIQQSKWILIFGIVNGLGMLCKVHMIFLWGGFGLYVMIHNRAWLSKWSFYVSGLITLLIFYPVIDWNIKQDFITYRFHSNRVSHANQGFNINSFTQYVLGQFFYTHLLLFPLFMFSLWKAISEKHTKPDHFKLLLIFVSVPLILVSTYLACFDTVLPHWTGPSYLGISLIAACWIGKNEHEKKYNSWLKISSIFSLTIALLGVLTISFYPGTLGKKGSYDLGSGDFTLDMYGWNQAKNKIDSVLQSDIKNKRMKADAPFVSHKWFPAAHEDFYICKPLNRTMLVLGDTIDIHQYLWLNKTKKPLKPGDDAYLMVPSNYYDNPFGRWKDYFVTIEKADTLTITRLGKVVKKIMITRLRNYKVQ